MKEFVTVRDIEDLGAQGIRRILIDDSIVLTDLAIEKAAQLGIVLVREATAASALPDLELPLPSPTGLSSSGPPRRASQVLEPRPKGCLHGHLEAGGAARGAQRSHGVPDDSSSRSLVDRLVEAVRQLSH